MYLVWIYDYVNNISRTKTSTVSDKMLSQITFQTVHYLTLCVYVILFYFLNEILFPATLVPIEIFCFNFLFNNRNIFFYVSFIAVFVKVMHIICASFSLSSDTFTKFKTKKVQTPSNKVIPNLRNFFYKNSYHTKKSFIFTPTVL